VSIKSLDIVKSPILKIPFWSCPMFQFFLIFLKFLCDEPIKVTPCQKENLIKGSFFKHLVQKHTQKRPKRCIQVYIKLLRAYHLPPPHRNNMLLLLYPRQGVKNILTPVV
jgi:hypothetical protein